MKKVFVKSELASSLLAIVAILASTTLLNSKANALTRPPAEDRDPEFKEWRNNKSDRVNLSRDNENQQQRQEYRQPQIRQEAPRHEAPRQEPPRQEEKRPSQQDLSRINQMQFGRPNPFPNQNNYQRPPQNPEPPKVADRDNRRDERRDDERRNYRHDDHNNEHHNDDRRRDNDKRHDSRRNDNWNNGWNWGSNNNNHNDYRRDDKRYNNNYSWNHYDNNSRKHFEFGRREGQNYWGPNGNNWSRWNNSWGDPNYYARRWGFDSYDKYRGWRRGNVWYSHPSLWNDWGGWYSFFLSDGIWGFSYSNYGDPYYNSYGNQCLKMQASDWQYGRRAIYSFVACLNRWGQYEEVRGTRNFEGWDY